MSDRVNRAESLFARTLSLTLLAGLSAIIAWGFYRELSAGAIQFSDVTLHLAILRQLDEVVRSGGSAFDFWFDISPFGYALFRSYQHLPHLLMYGCYRLFGGSVELAAIVPSFTLILAALLPWSFFWASRVLGFSWWASVSCGLFSALLTEEGAYGLGLQNYTWGTHGIIMQLWAVVFLVPASSYAIRFIRGGGGIGAYAALSFLAVGSHILAAYIVIGTIAIAAGYLFVARAVSREILIRRIGMAMAIFLLITAHQWVFIILDRALVHRSTLEPHWKFASRGVDWVVSHFFSGALFDGARFPVVSALLLVGAAVVVSNVLAKMIWRRARTDAESSASIVAVALVFWMSILCGYELWGWLFQSLPLVGTMHLHRFIVAVQVFGLLLAGYGAGMVLSFVPSSLIRVSLLLIAMVIPLQGLFGMFQRSHDLLTRIEQAQGGSGEHEKLLQKLTLLPRAWLYLGMHKSWANELRVAGLVPLYHLTVARGLPTLGMLFHSMSITGDILFEFEPTREQDLRLFGVRYSVSPLSWRSPEFLKTVATLGPYRLSEYSDAHLLSVEDLAFEGWGSPEETVRYLQAWVRSSLPAQHAYGEILQRSVSGTVLGVPFASRSLNVPVRSQPPGTLVEESPWQSQKISGVVRAEREAIVVFRTGYHPNWIAHVDGVRGEVLHVTPGFLAVRVGPGTHYVSFEYVPSRLKPWLVLLALITISLVINSERRLRRRLIHPV